jgi:hypothetical protein
MTELKPIHSLRSHISKRDRLAKMLGMRVARNTKENGLYVFSYGTFLMVRVYRGDGPDRKIFEERPPAKGFPTDELVAKLMLLS